MTKETAICKIHKENNIIHIQFNESVIVKLSDLCEIYEYINEVYSKTSLFKLIDFRFDFSIDKKAKQFFTNQPAKYKDAYQAILVGKKTTPAIFDIFVGMDEENNHFKLFTDYNKAVEWLHSHSK